MESGDTRIRDVKEINRIEYFNIGEIRDLCGKKEFRSPNATRRAYEDFLAGRNFPLDLIKRL